MVVEDFLLQLQRQSFNYLFQYSLSIACICYEHGCIFRNYNSYEAVSSMCTTNPRSAVGVDLNIIQCFVPAVINARKCFHAWVHWSNVSNFAQKLTLKQQMASSHSSSMWQPLYMVPINPPTISRYLISTHSSHPQCDIVFIMSSCDKPRKFEHPLSKLFSTNRDCSICLHEDGDL